MRVRSGCRSALPGSGSEAHELWQANETLRNPSAHFFVRAEITCRFSPCSPLLMIMGRLRSRADLQRDTVRSADPPCLPYSAARPGQAVRSRRNGTQP
jgi:hypothetical protein